jgi:hypothetical protein
MRALAFLLIAVPLAAPAAAQGVSMEALQHLEACLAGLDPDSVAARAEAYAAERGYEDRIGALCAAGDRNGAAALEEAFMGDYFAADPEGERMMTCIWGSFANAGTETIHPCDQ